MRKSDWDAFLGYLAPAKGEVILDVGAGNGAKAAQVLQASGGAEVCAVDPSAKKIASMKRGYPALKGSVAGAESLPFPDGYFDKAYSTMALHHFGDLDRGLAEIARVLKQRGSFTILEVEPHSMVGRLFRFFERLMGERMNIMSKDQLLARLGTSKGLKVVRSDGLGGSYLVQLSRT